MRRMEHHVLAAAMEATANEKYYNSLLWLEYLKRCKDLVETPSFSGIIPEVLELSLMRLNRIMCYSSRIARHRITQYDPTIVFPYSLGRDLSKVFSAMTRMRPLILQKDSAHARVAEDIITSAKNRVSCCSACYSAFHNLSMPWSLN